MSILILNENRQSRTPGNAVKDLEVIYQGTLIVKEDNAGVTEIRAAVDADIAAAIVPSGIALDTNQQPPIAPTGSDPHVVGQGYDYTNYNRGGLVSSGDDMLIKIWGNSLIKADDTWALSKGVYWDGGNARYTDTSGVTTHDVGVLEEKEESGGSVTSITVKVKTFSL